MDFSAPPPGGKLDGAQKGQLMEQVKAQIAVANAQELLQVRYKAGLPYVICRCDTYFIAYACLLDNVKPGTTITHRVPNCYIMYVSVTADTILDTFNLHKSLELAQNPRIRRWPALALPLYFVTRPRLPRVRDR